MNIKTATLNRILKRVHLGGLVEECVLNEEKGGVNSIQAIDLTNSLVLSITGKTEFEDFDELGLGDVGTLSRYLDSAEQETDVELSGNRLVFTNKFGSFKYLLSQPDLIPTAVEDKNIVKALVDNCTHEVTLQEEFHKNFSQNMALTKTNNASVTIKKGNKVSVSGGLDSEHQFTLNVGKANVIEETRNNEFTIPIYGTHFGAVLNVLDWTVRENLPKLMMSKGKPIVIKQNKDVWCLTIVKGEST